MSFMSESNDQWWREYDDGRFDADFSNFYKALSESSAKATRFEVVTLFEGILHNCMIYCSSESDDTPPVDMPPVQEVEAVLRAELERVEDQIKILIIMRKSGCGSSGS